MSWLARSIANTLRIDDDDRRSTAAAATTGDHTEEHSEEPDRLDNHQRGMKEDLSEFGETLTRQIWGVASFLAPPPNHLPDHCISYWDSAADSDSYDNPMEDTSHSGLWNQPGKSQSVFSDLKHTLPFRLEDQIGGAAGITEESLAFASNIAHHPETWLDFPIPEEEDNDDFDMSDAQYKHAMAIERLLPRFAALRIELCPPHMSKGYFWKVYFVLLHSRLNKHDAELLSTPQVIAARSMWMQELQKRTKPESNKYARSIFDSKESASLPAEDSKSISFDFSKYISLGTSTSKVEVHRATREFEAVKHSILHSDGPSIDKAVINKEPVVKTRDKELVSGPSYRVPDLQYEDDDGDDWLEQNSELDGYSRPTIFFGTDDDVSFSDLEDDDYTMPVKSKPLPHDLDM